ncbi:UNVERIFIED_CONTAM: hypothetical protein Cloal_0690 [Acetivibrio alkalicellulosi]
MQEKANTYEEKKETNWFKTVATGVIITIVGAFLWHFIQPHMSSKPNNSTPENAAKTFINALIRGDEEMLNKINRSDPFHYPTHYLLSDFASEYSNYKLSDFEIKVVEEKKNKYKVSVQTYDEKINVWLRIDPIGGSYYFNRIETPTYYDSSFWN